MEQVWKPHATVAAIIERDGKFLMVEEMSDGLVVYNQPAGHLEPDESLLEAVIRETAEETAWSFTPKYISGIYHWNQPQTQRCFLRVTFVGSCSNHRQEQVLDDGIIRAVWLSRNELAEQPEKLRSPMVLRCIDDYLSGKQYPLELLVNV